MQFKIKLKISRHIKVLAPETYFELFVEGKLNDGKRNLSHNIITHSETMIEL